MKRLRGALAVSLALHLAALALLPRPGEPPPGAYPRSPGPVRIGLTGGTDRGASRPSGGPGAIPAKPPPGGNDHPLRPPPDAALNPLPAPARAPRESAMIPRRPASRKPPASPPLKPLAPPPDAREEAGERPPLLTPSRVEAQGQAPAAEGVTGAGESGTPSGRGSLAGGGAPGGATTAGPGPQAPSSTTAVPIYRLNPSPIYPPRARRQGWEGQVLLDVLVGSDGRVEDLKLVQSSGHALLDRAALEAVGRWRFEPGRVGTEPVAVWVQVPVRFQLQ